MASYIRQPPDWMCERYPLRWLPHSVRQRLADNIDLITAVGHGFHSLAEYLGFRGELIFQKAQGNNQYRSSPTLLLLSEYEMMGGTIQGVQEALQIMQHVAAYIIPENLNVIRREWQREQLQQQQSSNNHSFGRGVRGGSRQGLYSAQNTEQSHCSCQNCHRAQFGQSTNSSPNHHASPPPYEDNHPSVNRQSNNSQNPSARYREMSIPHDHYLPSQNAAMATFGGPHCHPQDHPPPSYSPSNSLQREPPFGGQQSHPQDHPPPSYSPSNCLQREPPSGHRSSTDSRSTNQSGGTALGIRSISMLPSGYHSSSESRTNRSVSMPEEKVRHAALFSDDCLANPINKREYYVENLTNRNETKNENSKDKCYCEKCRLQSDPHETRLLTLTSAPLSTCLFVNDTEIVDRVNSGLSGIQICNPELPCDCESCSLTDPHQTGVKTLYVEQNDFRESNTHSENSNSEKGDVIFCSKSADGEHELGARVSSCPVCRKYASPQQIQNMSNKNSYIEREERKSWHGEQSNAITHSPKASSSEPELGKYKNQTLSNIPEACKTRIQDTLQFRLSFGSISDCQNQEKAESQDSVTVRFENNLSLSQNIVDELSDTNNEETTPPIAFDNHQNASACQPLSRSSEITVFVTYSWNGMTDKKLYLKEVTALCHSLKEAGIKVRIDMDPESFRELGLNRLDWIDRMTDNATFVIVCLSPTYLVDIQEPTPNQASPNTTQLNARYIYDKLRGEYYNNQARNKRLIPVLFPNSCKEPVLPSSVPTCMASTCIYSYPKYVEAIINRILGVHSPIFRSPYYDQ